MNKGGYSTIWLENWYRLKSDDSHGNHQMNNDQCLEKTTNLNKFIYYEKSIGGKFTTFILIFIFPATQLLACPHITNLDVLLQIYSLLLFNLLIKYLSSSQYQLSYKNCHLPFVVQQKLALFDQLKICELYDH